jgi:hypothetical protein
LNKSATNEALPAGYTNNWGLPSASNNTYSSRTKLNAAEMVKMGKDELKSHCGWGTKESPKVNADSECLVVFAIVPNLDATIVDSQILYNFVVYRNFLQLLPFTPALGFVKEGDFMYFLYHELCPTCTVLFSV